MTGPVSRALDGSYLAADIRPGLQAVPNEPRGHIAESIRRDFADSLDLDAASRTRHPGDARWDYLLGHAPSSQVIGVETHSAETSQVTRVIQKRAASLVHLRDQLRAGHRVAAWYWAASGPVDFVPHEKTVIRLNDNGIRFVGGRLEPRHLAELSSKPIPAPGRRRTRPRR
ncbi:MAG TPA: hypothetical protein VGD37_27695 [Kofleriaceae bacterium]